MIGVISLHFRQNSRQITNVYKIIRNDINDSDSFDLKMAKGQWEEFKLCMNATVLMKRSVEKLDLWSSNDDMRLTRSAHQYSCLTPALPHVQHSSA